ncbi:MAG TPA: 4'-phosphopantetheinyl transferase superfamily protein [Pirellulales bacterium]|nr:4'-phosphopantetheinyl transferase superfamily protein [Pirellulales bacterium]
MSRLTLAPDEVHVWHAAPEQLAQPEWLAHYESLLSGDERERQRRFVRPIDALHYLVAHALVRTALSQYVDVAPQDWRFEANQYGRPQVAAPAAARDLQFNLSHTAGLVACGIAWRREIGVDVEDLQRPELSLNIADRYFSPQETAELKTQPIERQPERFFEYWTLKEAYIKARGVGMSLPLDRFTIGLRAEGAISISFSPPLVDDPASWQFVQFRPTPRHVLSVAVHRLAGETVCISCGQSPWLPSSGLDERMD